LSLIINIRGIRGINILGIKLFLSLEV